jgi:hypothetical protein
LLFVELLLRHGFVARSDARSQFIYQQAELWGVVGALRAEVELVSLLSSLEEWLAVIEEERATTAVKLVEALRQAEDTRAAFDVIAQEVARKEAALEARVAELTDAAASSIRNLEAAREQNASLRDQLGVIIDGVYSYQTSIRLARGQVPHRSQGTLLPSSVNPRYRIRGTNM